ncbi:uncharacterized protein MONBRDRAFT_36134 [Monosiga brevicollis MX1]|uniref:MYND-type domain-containing protein n=1 Tax=Monosiga brevicollis TaxID=81824 RepID=A9UTA5_MONBE|nr:uncharacterized protein MONBRDRAFT_36134 [Monosiga brevicollis MX1]EDQ91460.1 predicted protein [Monosiga brevicollis MX1]|eukprot:XP_001743882.1 hypothetical protein [Monosiga brevicollis MX1]
MSIEALVHLVCANCGGTGERLKRCTACSMTAYCNAECQKQHWRHHKKECNPCVQCRQPCRRNARAVPGLVGLLEICSTCFCRQWGDDISDKDFFELIFVWQNARPHQKGLRGLFDIYSKRHTKASPCRQRVLTRWLMQLAQLAGLKLKADVVFDVNVLLCVPPSLAPFSPGKPMIVACMASHIADEDQLAKLSTCLTSATKQSIQVHELILSWSCAPKLRVACQAMLAQFKVTTLYRCTPQQPFEHYAGIATHLQQTLLQEVPEENVRLVFSRDDDLWDMYRIEQILDIVGRQPYFKLHIMPAAKPEDEAPILDGLDGFGDVCGNILKMELIYRRSIFAGPIVEGAVYEFWQAVVSPKLFLGFFEIATQPLLRDQYCDLGYAAYLSAYPSYRAAQAERDLAWCYFYRGYFHNFRCNVYEGCRRHMEKAALVSYCDPRRLPYLLCMLCDCLLPEITDESMDDHPGGLEVPASIMRLYPIEHVLTLFKTVAAKYQFGIRFDNMVSSLKHSLLNHMPRRPAGKEHTEQRQWCLETFVSTFSEFVQGESKNLN